MIGLLRSELLKQRTTRTNLGLLLSMTALIALVVLLHVVSLAVHDLRGADGQLKVFGLGTTFGMVFASLLGAMSITSEIRHGTIRPTFLTTPKRRRVIGAKVVASMIAGATFGLLAEVLAVAVGCAGLAARNVHIAPSGGDFAQLIVGGAVAAAMWAAIGVGIGALVGNQVGAAISLVVWLLFVEQTLIGSVPSAAKFAPGASAGALPGAIIEHTANDLVAPALGALLIVAYATAAAFAGSTAITRRDVN